MGKIRHIIIVFLVWFIAFTSSLNKSAYGTINKLKQGETFKYIIKSGGRNKGAFFIKLDSQNKQGLTLISWCELGSGTAFNIPFCPGNDRNVRKVSEYTNDLFLKSWTIEETTADLNGGNWQVVDKWRVKKNKGSMTLERLVNTSGSSLALEEIANVSGIEGIMLRPLFNKYIYDTPFFWFEGVKLLKRLIATKIDTDTVNFSTINAATGGRIPFFKIFYDNSYATKLLPKSNRFVLLLQYIGHKKKIEPKSCEVLVNEALASNYIGVKGADFEDPEFVVQFNLQSGIVGKLKYYKRQKPDRELIKAGIQKAIYEEFGLSEIKGSKLDEVVQYIKKGINEPLIFKIDEREICEAFYKDNPQRYNKSCQELKNYGEIDTNYIGRDGWLSFGSSKDKSIWCGKDSVKVQGGKDLCDIAVKQLKMKYRKNSKLINRKNVYLIKRHNELDERSFRYKAGLILPQPIKQYELKKKAATMIVKKFFGIDLRSLRQTPNPGSYYSYSLNSGESSINKIVRKMTRNGVGEYILQLPYEMIRKNYCNLIKTKRGGVCAEKGFEWIVNETRPVTVSDVKAQYEREMQNAGYKDCNVVLGKKDCSVSAICYEVSRGFNLQ